MAKYKQILRKTVTTQYQLGVTGYTHRDNGPALIIERDDGTTERKYLRTGRYHRKDGPAIVVKSRAGKLINEEFWLNGKQVGRERVMKRKATKIAAKRSAKPSPC
jgi:hypothetical protein